MVRTEVVAYKLGYYIMVFFARIIVKVKVADSGLVCIYTYQTRGGVHENSSIQLKKTRVTELKFILLLTHQWI